MQNSRTLGRSKSIRQAGTQSRAIALLVVAVVILVLVGEWGCGSGAGQSVNNPPSPNAPAISAIMPNTAVAGGAAFTLTISGANFVKASTVTFGGATTATTFDNSTQLTAAIPASSVASTGTIAVTVTNPASSGGTSNSINFSVTSGSNPVPTIAALSPGCVPAGEQFIDSTDNLLTVISNSATDFVAGSVVRWNGSDRPTSSNGSVNALVAQISASDIAAAGTASVTVFNPAPGGGISNSLPFTIMTGASDPRAIAVDPTGKFAYVINGGCGYGSYVSMYTINSATGALASIEPPATTYGYGLYTESVTVDPSGKFVYATNSGNVFDYSSEADGNLAMYTIDTTTGALTSTGPITGEINGNCPGLCFPAWVVADPSGKFAYVAVSGNDSASTGSVITYAINATNGALASTGTTGTIATGINPVSVAVDPAGKFVYVANSGSNDVSMYTINTATGALTSAGTVATGTGPSSVAVDPAGMFAYVADNGANDVSMYTMNATTGALTSIGTIATGTSPVTVAVDPTGKFAYVTNYSSNNVSMYTINATTGALTSIGTIAAGQYPTYIAVHPSGKFAYVTNVGSNNISMYDLDTTTGVLTLIGTVGS
jgi:YVTN family beta-propeller protein